MSDPITFDSALEGYEMFDGTHIPQRILVVAEEGRPLPPSQRNATDADLQAAGYAKVPSVEELADAIRTGLWSGILDYVGAAHAVLCVLGRGTSPPSP